MTAVWDEPQTDEVEPDILCRDLVRIFVTEGVEVQALQGLTLRVERGEVVALVGASGSGKSTLLSILSGLDRPTGGAARVAGQDLVTMTRRERVAFQRHRVGFVWQQTARNLLPYLTAAQNVVVPMALAGTPRRGAERAARATELLAMLGVADVADRLPAHMSGGEQQRVAIAVALANGPRVLLADEPTGELDEATSAEVLEAFRTANAELGTTVLVVTHDPAVADHVSRTVRIRDGRTSLEVLRRREVGADGVERDLVEEFAVLDPVGRMQLPPEFVTQLGLRDRVRLDLEPDHVSVWPGTSGGAAATRTGGPDPTPGPAPQVGRHAATKEPS
ncbi:ABC transporter ATP-binding protein [Sanguibacter sp. HDW7]|uniref:ABC transporter ATP-binding protein n=1 Tax=Sanguibacter sp. HDW7 TaxID=2714931 RepID=UPI00140E2A10|nr:ABC transporter ATP-binding protein [Sanguibacter sp. HDW7]QIK84042.1 ABC transporter ATP-binding protein [Sanguibacter sp. HDW7]